MIIDCILDRLDAFKAGEIYDPHAFYRCVSRYDGYWCDEITRAMDYGTEQDVRIVLCGYIDANEYNPLIKNYINRVFWNSQTPAMFEAAAVVDFEMSTAAAMRLAELKRDAAESWRGLLDAEQIAMVFNVKHLHFY